MYGFVLFRWFFSVSIVYYFFVSFSFMKILYGVCGVGRGHASRSVEIIRELKKGNKVLVVSYGEAYNILNSEFGDASELRWFKIHYKHGEIKQFRTFIKNIPSIPNIAAHNFSSLYRLVKKFKPDAIVSDFELNSLIVGKLLGVPVISVSNQHMIKYHSVDKSVEELLFNYIPDQAMTLLFYPADAFIVTHFLEPNKKPRNGNVFFFGPVVRREFLNFNGGQEDYLVGYFSDATVLEEFAEFFSENFPKEKLFLFGFGKNKKIGNVGCRVTDNDAFMDKLVHCKGVFCHGGFSLISEALFLQKPVCVFTPKGFYERHFNGLALERSGFGVLMGELGVKKTGFFLNGLKNFSSAIEKAKLKPGTKDIAEKIISLSKELC